MVWEKSFAIHFVSKHNPSIDIQGPVEFNRRSIVAIWLWKSQFFSLRITGR